MSFGEVLRELRDDNLTVTITQLRWAVDSGKVSKPAMDGSRRLAFGDQDVDAIKRYFHARQRPCAVVA